MRTSAAAVTSAGPRSSSAASVLFTLYFIFFFCGLTLCFESVFLPEFKEHFHLNYQQQMYTMFAKNIPFLLAPLIGFSIRRTGYRACMSAAMFLFSAGTLLLIPGIRTANYLLTLGGFLLIGIGFNCELVAGNPMLSALGPPEGSSSRLNLGNALGAVAQILAPATVSILIPSSVSTVEGKLPYIEGLFGFLGLVLATVGLLTLRMPEVDIDHNATDVDQRPSSANVLRRPRIIFAFLTILVCLGIEAGQFGFYRNFLEDPAVGGLSARQSQQLFTLYFAIFAAGRLAATWLQKRVAPERHIVVNMICAMVCLAVAIWTRGTWAVAAVTLLGFFTSILFPTLYGLAIQNAGEWTGRISGLITMGFIGCAFLPVLQGRLADTAGLQNSYLIGFGAYVLATAFALSTPRARRSQEQPSR